MEQSVKYSAGRRPTREVRIGKVIIGGGRPVAPQSMTSCSTMDTAGCVEQIRRLHAAGCRIVRLTTQGPREAENLKNIREAIDAAGLGDIALVADVHFNPAAALVAAEYADKVRINPGNFGGAGEKFTELLAKCRMRGVSLRIGVNHGSLAPHVVERWGDTPQGMVESALEYLHVCRAEGFGQVVVSMKSSNVRVMVHACRLLAGQMEAWDMDYPLHLGVTEAGDGIAGCVKSAVGIGALLAEGLGDTIRVSLTQSPETEIPVARQIIAHFDGAASGIPAGPCRYSRQISDREGNIGGGQTPLLYGELDGTALAAVGAGRVVVLEAAGSNRAPEWRARIMAMDAAGDCRPVILCAAYRHTDPAKLAVVAACDFGPLFIDGLADGIRIDNRGGAITRAEIDEVALSILQAARLRFSRTEYIACPGCGRTLFDLQGTLAAVRARTSHLTGLRIAVMGCIVNGPGEMADADYGYVGEGGGRVTIYRGRLPVRRSVPDSEAIDALIEIIRGNGEWKEPE